MRLFDNPLEMIKTVERDVYEMSFDIDNNKKELLNYGFTINDWNTVTLNNMSDYFYNRFNIFKKNFIKYVSKNSPVIFETIKQLSLNEKHVLSYLSDYISFNVRNNKLYELCIIPECDFFKEFCEKIFINICLYDKISNTNRYNLGYIIFIIPSLYSLKKDLNNKERNYLK